MGQSRGMGRVRLKEAVAVAVLLVAAASLHGHGRNSTSVRADVTRAAVDLRIDAVVVDVLELAGTAAGEWEALPPGEREEVLRRGARRFAELVRVVQDGARILPDTGLEIELPAGGDQLHRRMAVEQQAVVIRMRLELETAPERLTFWAAVGDDAAAAPIPVQLLLRQEGELVLLPAELGPGALISRQFDWERKPARIADLTDLTAVTCSWRNRPVSGVLEVGEGEAVWRVFIPVQVMQSWLGADETGSLAGWEEQLRTLFGLAVDGADVAPAGCGLRVLPIAAHAHSHAGGSGHRIDADQMLEWRMAFPVAASARRVAAFCRSLPEPIPLVYMHVLSTVGSAFSLLTPAAPATVEF